MQSIEPETLKAFARTLDGQMLETMQQRRSFTLHVVGSELSVTPASTGKQRTIANAELRRVLAQFARSGSFAPGEYLRASGSASYLLTIIGRYLRR